MAAFLAEVFSLISTDKDTQSYINDRSYDSAKYLLYDTHVCFNDTNIM